MPDDPQQTAAANLSVTLAPLVADASGDGIKAALDQIAGLQLRYVQVSATMNGLRPRDLDRTARRDLLASLRRRELALSGFDAWIPESHFTDPAHADRAVGAMSDIIELAGDLGRVPVSVAFPRDNAAVEPIVTLSRLADRLGVPIADHTVASAPAEGIGVGIDPAAHMAQASDPVAVVHAAGIHCLDAARLCDLLTTGMRGPINTPRQSRLDVTAYRIALDVNGYRRPIIIDARQWSETWRGIEQTIAAWRDAVP